MSRLPRSAPARRRRKQHERQRRRRLVRSAFPTRVGETVAARNGWRRILARCALARVVARVETPSAASDVRAPLRACARSRQACGSSRPSWRASAPRPAAPSRRATASSSKPRLKTAQWSAFSTRASTAPIHSALYGDLGPVLSGRHPVHLTHVLVSVKILPTPTAPANRPELYGAVTDTRHTACASRSRRPPRVSTTSASASTSAHSRKTRSARTRPATPPTGSSASAAVTRGPISPARRRAGRKGRSGSAGGGGGRSSPRRRRARRGGGRGHWPPRRSRR